MPGLTDVREVTVESFDEDATKRLIEVGLKQAQANVK
jgi:hypothetical protein